MTQKNVIIFSLIIAILCFVLFFVFFKEQLFKKTSITETAKKVLQEQEFIPKAGEEPKSEPVSSEDIRIIEIQEKKQIHSVSFSPDPQNPDRFLITIPPQDKKIDQEKKSEIKENGERILYLAPQPLEKGR